jgi:hypothetical protein
MQQSTKSEFILSDDEIKEAILNFYHKKISEMGYTFSVTLSDVKIDVMPKVSIVINTLREI